MAERSDLPGDLRLLGRAAAPGGAHPGSGPLLGLYESQPAPAELLLELLEQPSARPGFSKEGRRLQRGMIIEPSSRVVKPPSAGVLCVVVFLSWLLRAGAALPIHVCRSHHAVASPPLHLC